MALTRTHKAIGLGTLISMAPLFLGVIWIEDRYNQSSDILELQKDHVGEVEKLADRIETYQHILDFHRSRIRDIDYMEQTGTMQVYHQQQRQQAKEEAARLEGFIFGLRQLQTQGAGHE